MARPATILAMILLWTSITFFYSFEALRKSSDFNEITAKGRELTIKEASHAAETSVDFLDDESSDRLDMHELKNVSFPYWNLSCPLEMSTFSAAHIGGGDYLTRALKAVQVAKPFVTTIQRHMQQPKKKNQRYIFIGDSLLRQVFISLACHANIEHAAVPWFSRRTGRTNHPNTIARGPHSKFEEARVWLDNGLELIFHHGIGGILTLGGDYRSHDENNLWIESCFRKRPLTAQVLARGTHYTEGYTTHETITLGPDDFVIMNGSVHGERQLNLNNIADVARCFAETARTSMSSTIHKQWPKLLYFVTGAEHFPTHTGQYELELVNKSSYECLQESVGHARLMEEKRVLDGLLPFAGTDTLDLQYRNGDLHVGGRDCLHWIMPGLPDVFAASLLASIDNMTSDKE